MWVNWQNLNESGVTVTLNEEKVQARFLLSHFLVQFDQHTTAHKHLLTFSLTAGVCKCMGTRSSGTQGGFLAHIRHL